MADYEDIFARTDNAMHLAPAELPITESDEFIEQMLENASTPALMMAMVHMSGSADILNGTIRPKTPTIAEVQGRLSETEKAEVRRQALGVIAAYRDRGGALPPPPSPQTVKRMMDFLIGEDMPHEYVPMMLEELALDGVDHRKIDLSAARRDGTNPVRVVVIGGGMSGLLTAMRLQAEGVEYVLVEKNSEVGGTWFENRYPGCRVDVPSHFYSYSFALNHGWSHLYARRDELFQYFNELADKSGVREHIRFGTEAIAARFDESNAQWEIEVRGPNGDLETLTGDVLISSVGQLNRPMVPDIPGRKRFKGVATHSAEWPVDLDVTGKRVAVIGTGASAIQIVPEIAKTAAHLDVFQRTPVWLLPNPHYHEAVSEEEQWLLRKIPFYSRWLRFLLFYPGTDGTLPRLRIDPSWPHQDRSISAENEADRELFTEHMRKQIPDNPDLLAKVVPPYPPYIKRMNQDNGGWLAALQQDHVDLVTCGIREITEDGIIDVNGVLHTLDVIVFATGFHAGKFLWPMEIAGREGRKLNEMWGDTPRAYLGITVPYFPNLFILYGPGTNLAHGGSIIFNSECQVRYALSGIQQIADSGGGSLEVREEAYEKFAAEIANCLDGLVWSNSAAGSWYKNASGKVITTSPWRLVDYWTWTRELHANDYITSAPAKRSGVLDCEKGRGSADLNPPAPSRLGASLERQPVPGETS